MNLGKIIYNDRNLLVLNKTSGLVVTSEGKANKESLETILKSKYDWARKIDRGGIVHRLDKGTSGVLLVAKNDEYLKMFKDQFKSRRVYKEYRALVEGDVSFEGEINVPLLKKNYGRFGRRGVGVGGKNAISQFELIEKYLNKSRVYSLVKVILKTGRTHQIRAHFSYLGWPLVGDDLYGGKTDLIKRPFLHAKTIAIEYPLGASFEVDSDLADDLNDLLARMEIYEEN